MSPSKVADARPTSHPARHPAGWRLPPTGRKNVTAVGRPHVSTPEAFSKAATPIYIFINNSKIALFCYAIDIVSYIT